MIAIMSGNDSDHTRDEKNALPLIIKRKEL